MKFQIAILGATGYVAKSYRREIRECASEAKIVAVGGRRQDLLRAVAEEDGAELFTSDWQQAIQHPDVNLVLICTPDAFHHESAMKCAELGLHVICEKPIGANAAEALEICSAIQEKQLAHFVPFWTRYIEVYRTAKEVYSSGRLGEVRAFVYRWHNPRPANMPFTWRDDAALSSSGSIADVGSHAYDAIRWILGEEARRVLTHADVLSPPKTDLGDINLREAQELSRAPSGSEGVELRTASACDFASISIEMHGGTVGTMLVSHASFLRKGVAPELELHGTDGSLSIDRISGEVRLFLPDRPMETLAITPDLGFPNRFRQFAFPALRERLSGQASDHPGVDDGYRAQLFTDAAARSAQQARWVELADIENELMR